MDPDALFDDSSQPWPVKFAHEEVHTNNSHLYEVN